MSIRENNYSTRNMSFSVRQGDTSKRAGVNRFTLKTSSDDWQSPTATVNMTIREARSLQRFLNQTLS